MKLSDLVRIIHQKVDQLDAKTGVFLAIELIIDCILGEFDDSSGETLFIEQGDDEFNED